MSMAQAKNAVITTAIVLGVVFVLRQFPTTRGIVNKALVG